MWWCILSSMALRVREPSEGMEVIAGVASLEYEAGDRDEISLVVRSYRAAALETK